MPWPLPLTVLMTPPFRRAWLLHGEPGNEKQSIWMRLLVGLTVFLVLISPFEVQANYYRQFEHGRSCATHRRSHISRWGGEPRMG